MSHDLICAWLGLPAAGWPPDHYSLLGLKPGEKDPVLIEERVHQRLDAVRRYQMTHPEQATEAMNRIAQAFVCLTEPASKRVYDTALLGTAVMDAPATEPTADRVEALTATVVEDREPLVLVYNAVGPETPPPIRRSQPILEAIPVPTAIAVEEPIPVATVAEVVPIVEPVETIADIAGSAIARRGLVTKRQLFQRIVRTRYLLDLWNQAGKYLASPKRRLSRAADVKELLRILSEVREELKEFPPLLGVAGQPGYLVVALTKFTQPMMQTLTPTERESLARDWQAGKTFLDAHRDILRAEARAMRHRTVFQWLGRLVRTTIAEKPGWIILLLAVLAINVALWRTYVYGWVERLARPTPVKVSPTTPNPSLP